MPLLRSIQSPARRREDAVEMTCAVDQRSHLISDVDHVAGFREGKGTWRALCGYVVVAASLASPPSSKPCSICSSRA